MIRFRWPIVVDLDRPRRDKLDATLIAAAQRVQRLLPIDNVDVAIALGARSAIPEWAVGGFTPGPMQITLFLDPANPHFADTAMPERLSSTLAHELHHAQRMRGPGYGTTLGETLVTEGLAQQFEQETGHPVAFYSLALAGTALAQMAERALHSLDELGYDHAAWFFGRTGDALYPRHGGYALAYALVRNWLAASGTTAAAAVSIDANEVLQPWRSGALGVD
ncbi:MAG TPA: DUF2268 domain-containing putative Zn-dependent protease [Stellaceae bacterium]|jgi:uncharacterized protein YjaZ|nr:DUF2268 domain-containing putative Zn-dependent protease [Stellaceae bacterium]